MRALSALRDDGSDTGAIRAGLPSAAVLPPSLDIAAAWGGGPALGPSTGVCLLARNQGIGIKGAGIKGAGMPGTCMHVCAVIGFTLPDATRAGPMAADRLASVLFQIGIPLFFAPLISGALADHPVSALLPTLLAVFLLVLRLPLEAAV
ncbi:MAG: hypothetical protein AAGC92_12015 [Pseudomonadota bacterium]